MGDAEPLEAQSQWDGSWYDLDADQTHPAREGDVWGLKVVYA
jgi:hypothetical protein